MKTAKLGMFTNDKQNYKGTKGKSFLSKNCIKVRVLEKGPLGLKVLAMTK